MLEPTGLAAIEVKAYSNSRWLLLPRDRGEGVPSPVRLRGVVTRTLESVAAVGRA